MVQSRVDTVYANSVDTELLEEGEVSVAGACNGKRINET